MSSGNYNKYDAFIIDNDLVSRGKLKQAAHNVVSFGKVYPFNTMNDVLSRFELGEKCDVVFLSHRFGQKEIQNFIEAAKQKKAGSDCAYILVMDSAGQDSTAIAQSFLGGANGFLFEPYSVESLRQIAELAAKVKLDNSKAREGAALKLLVTDIVKELDRIALKKSLGEQYAKERKKIESIMQTIAGFDEGSQAQYFDTLIEATCNLPPPIVATYSGASKRVKERMETKAKEDKQKRLTEG